MAYQRCTERNLVYKVYYPTFYTKRSLGAIYRKYRLVNLKYKLLARPKKPHKSHASRDRGRGLNRAAPLSISNKIGKKKGRKGKRGGNSSIKSTRLVFT